VSFYREKRVKTRKSHQCRGCLRKYPIGSELISVTEVFEGVLQSYYLCYFCKDWLDRNPGYFDDEDWAAGEIGEMRREEELRDAVNWRQYDRVEDG